MILWMKEEEPYIVTNIANFAKVHSSTGNGGTPCMSYTKQYYIQQNTYQRLATDKYLFVVAPGGCSFPVETVLLLQYALPEFPRRLVALS